MTGQTDQTDQTDFPIVRVPADREFGIDVRPGGRFDTILEYKPGFEGKVPRAHLEQLLKGGAELVEDPTKVVASRAPKG